MGATLTFHSDSVFDDGTGISGTFETTVTSDAEGHFSATLLPGRYDVVITPVGSSYTVLTEQLTIAPASDVTLLRGQLFSLRRSSQLGAAIVDFLGRPSPASASRRPPSPSRSKTGRAASAIARRWAPRTRPARSPCPSTSAPTMCSFRGGNTGGLPWAVLPDLEIREPGTTVPRQVELGAPVPMVGTVTGPDGMVLVDAEVRALARTESGRFIVVARGRTDDQGRYELLLPPSI